MKSLKKPALLLFVALAVAGQLYAQPAAPTAPPAPPATKAVQLTAEEMKQRASELRVRVRADIQTIHHLQAQARKDKDIIKLTCVNDKFIKLKAEANIFDAAHSELIAVLDADDRFAVFGRLTRAASDVRKVRDEAQGCIGEPELGRESTSDFTSPEILDDPTLGLPFDIEIEPPAYASPYT